MEYGSLGMDLRHQGCHRPHDHRPSLLIVVVVIIACFQAGKGQMEYDWMEGPWGRCEHSSCGYGGRQFRTITCVNARGQTINDHRCDPAIKPTRGRACYKACDTRFDSDDFLLTSDVTYQQGDNPGISYAPESMDSPADFPYPQETTDVEWVVSQWSSCRLLPGSQSCGRNSGVKTRNVTCGYKHRHGRVSSSLCDAHEETPVSSQSCELLCRQDCVVTEFSPWSNCDTSCQVTNRTRTRQVVVPPLHQGDHCPVMSDMSLCENCTMTYTYRFHDWSDCTPLKRPTFPPAIKSHPMIGYQTREVSCLNNKGALAADSHCQNKLPQTLLLRHRPCVMPTDCEVSAWSKLQPFNVSCRHSGRQIRHGYMVKTRQVTQLPLGDGRPCPSSLIEYIRVKDDNVDVVRPCKRAKWITSAWSMCQSVPGYNNCLTGKQSRRAVCVEAGDDSIERPVENHRCPQPEPDLEQPCNVECDWDCTVTKWSDWSVCTTGTCNGNRVRRHRSKRVEQVTGTRFRTRQPLTMQGPGGRPCPDLSETQMCIPKPCYHLNMTRDGCEPTYGTCGAGTRSFKAECLDRSWKKVRDRFCYETLSGNELWSTWENCYVPCPNDCVLSEWTEWSSCPDPCQVRVGERVSRTRRRHIIAYHSPGQTKSPCPDPQSLTELDYCPRLEDCNTYKWQVSAWTPCALDGPDSRHQCGRGRRSRTVKCVTSQNFPAAENRCEETVKPSSFLNCTVYCPVDCRFTEWSEWSSCGIDCLPIQARHIYPKRKRYRYILQYQENGGGTCPGDLEELDDCNDLPLCETFHWNATQWSDCILPPIHPMCGQGLMIRDISCFSSTAQGTRPMPISACLDNLGIMPTTTEVCYSPCESECEFTKWTSWTQCDSSCEGTRFRFRRPTNYSKKSPDCKDTSLYPRDEHQECHCHDVKLRPIGQWSDCIIQQDKNPHKFATMSFQSLQILRSNDSSLPGKASDTAYCGKGKRYKVISCNRRGPDKNGIMRCLGSDYEVEDCDLPCPVDCQMSQWSAWSDCAISGVDCGAGLQQRERRVETHPDNGGRECPLKRDHETEFHTRVCHVDCNYKLWKDEPWGPCNPDRGQKCGPGKQTRAVSCESVSRNGVRTTVDAGFCNHELEPTTIKSCSLPCPGECVLSEWSDWTPCTQPCNGQQLQKRHRRVLRQPAAHASNQHCQNMTEERLCERLKNCVEYKWELSPWTDCLVSGGGGECGIGHQERYARCRNEIRERVDDYLCDKFIGRVTEPLEYSCEVPCDNDCLMSSWAGWSTCSKSCGLGVTTRRRAILQSPTGNGRKCPERLDQSKPCHLKGCYTWRVTEWSPCYSQFGVCGSGIQERNVSCVADNGRVVNSSMCKVDPEKLVLQTTRNCHVPCPGECKLSEWTSWSNCFISCEDYGQGFTRGVRARSRSVLAMPQTGNAPCNQTLWYSDPCIADNCTEFIWKHTPWRNDRRDVWCESNSGMRVSGGCDKRQRPPERLECNQVHCIPPALCRDTDLCQCLNKSYVVHAYNRSAVTCIMNSTTPSPSLEHESHVAKEPNVWMYAVIAVCTVFVIAVTAALYNMCEMFRTGPRPRRKGLANGEAASTTGTMNSAVSVRVDKMASVSGTATPVSSTFREENLYKQLHPLPVSSHPSAQPSPSPSSRHPSDIPDAAALDHGCCRCDANAAAATAAPSSTATTGVTASKSSIIDTTLPPPPPDMVVHGNSSNGAGGGGGGVCVGDPSHGGVAYVNSVRTLNNSSTTNSTRMPSSLLRRDANRRYKRIHCLLPHRLALCFSCGNKSSVCMVDEEASSAVSSIQVGHDPEPMTTDQAQAMSLTRAHAIENMELCGGEFYTKTTCGFQNHHCMLPPTCDYRPNNLDLTTTYFDTCESDPCRDAINAPVSLGKFEPSLAAELQEEISRISPDVAQDLALNVEMSKCDESSSDSIAVSSELVSAKLEESSQCSLQLGDTAETYASQYYPPPPPPPPPPSLPLSAGGISSMRQQLLQQHQRTHHHSPYQQRSASSSPQPPQHQNRRSPNKRRRQMLSPPSPSPPPSQLQIQHLSKSSSLPGGSSLSPGSSSKFVRESPKTRRNNKLTNPRDPATLPHATSHSNPSLRHQDYGGGGNSSDDCSSMTNNNPYGRLRANPPSYYAPLHVDVPPLSPTQVEALVTPEIPEPCPPYWQKQSPYPSHHDPHPHHQPSYSTTPHGKPSSVSSPPSPLSLPPDFPSRSSQPPLHYHHNQHPHSTSPHLLHHHHRHNHQQHPRRQTQTPSYPSRSPSITPGSTSRSFVSLPERPASPPRNNLVEKTSEDSGHSTMSRSRTVSPGDFSGDLTPNKGQGSILSSSMGASSPPLRVQVSEESGHDSPTPSFCTSCRKELDRPTVPGLYLSETPDSHSQASNLSGMETSV